MRAYTCGPGTWNGPGGCTRHRSRTFPPTSRERRSSIPRWGRWRTASAVWRPRGCCRWASCSGSPACSGPRRADCTDGGRHCWRPGCSPPWPAPSSWARSRPMTRWRCSCWPWRRGWESGPRTVHSGCGRLCWSRRGSSWRRPTLPSTRLLCSPRWCSPSCPSRYGDGARVAPGWPRWSPCSVPGSRWFG